MKKIEIKKHSTKNKAIGIGIGIIIIVLVFFAVKIRKTIRNKALKEITVETNQNNNTQEIEWNTEENSEVININNIIQNNLEKEIKEIIEVEDVELEYETEYRNNENLPKGLIQVLQQGQDGKQELIIKKQYEGKNIISDEQIGKRILIPAINRIVEVGTSQYYNKYNIKVGDYVYSTPYDLEIKSENNKESNIITKISQSSKLEIKKKKGNWYYVKYDTYYGWIETDCVTYIVPNSTFNGNNNVNEQSKNQLIKSLSKNMKLNKPSGLTLEQFEKMFENEKKDKNGIFKENAKYFYYIEQSYGINGIFVAAIGIHESAWGTSKIATDKKNLFGYGAYDMSAYSSAYSYDGCGAGIDMIARVLIKHYLNPKGTSIYNGEIATGKHYNGSTLEGVNKKYATDKKWSDGVYSWMKYLYNKI